MPLPARRSHRLPFLSALAVLLTGAFLLFHSHPPEAPEPARSDVDIASNPARTQDASGLSPIQAPASTPASPQAPLALDQLPALSSLQKGTEWTFVFPDQTTAGVRVNFSAADPQNPALWMIGGALAEGGSFYLGHHQTTGQRQGWFIPWGKASVWATSPQATTWNFSLQPVTSLLCLPPGTISLSAPTGTITGVSGPAPGTANQFDVPVLSSRAGSSRVLFLDFLGGSITLPTWNSGNPVTYYGPPLDATTIEQLHARVSEDYAPFDVNVTTDPDVYQAAAVPPGTPNRRMRCIVSRLLADGTLPNGGIGGVAGLRSFLTAGITSPSADVCWVAIEPNNGSVSTSLILHSGANAMSHEFGHTLGLLHWSNRLLPGEPGEYYPTKASPHGGPAPDNWSPLMGNYNVATLAQWAKGEYNTAGIRLPTVQNQPGVIHPSWVNVTWQDDLALISSALSSGGSAYLPDDKGNSRATASPLQIIAETPHDGGLIATNTDEDYFQITNSLPGSRITLEVQASEHGSNLDLYAELQDAAGTVLSSNAAPLSRNAVVSAGNLPAGSYYLLVRGNAQGNPATNGWSRYGSLGTYRITGTVAGAPNAATIAAADPPLGTVGVPYTFTFAATNSPTSIYSAGGSLPPGLVISSSNTISGTPTSAGIYTVNLAAANAFGGTSRSFTFTIRGNTTLPAALNSYHLTWTTAGLPATTGSAWTGQRLVSQDGDAAARSGSIGHNADSLLSTTVTGPGLLTWSWKISAASGDRGLFRLNATNQYSLNGTSDWIGESFTIPSGTHTVQWIYRKDASGTGGEDALFVDQVRYLSLPDFPDGSFIAAGIVGRPWLQPVTAEPAVTSWQHSGGSLPPGISLDPTNGYLQGTPTASGVWNPTISATNPAGTSSIQPELHIFPDIPLHTALDTDGLAWLSSGTTPWFGNNTGSHDGVDAAHSGPITHRRNSVLSSTLTGPGTLSFYWKCSTEATFDPLTFSINGITQATLSGEAPWQLLSYELPAGLHTVVWEYRRDGSGNGGQNRGWVDQVTWTGNGPLITSPLTQTWTSGNSYYLPFTSDNPNVAWTLSGNLPPNVNFLGAPVNALIAVPNRPGTFTLNLTATAGAASTVRTLTLIIEPSFAAWARNRSLDPSSALEDPDSDGLNNFAEMAFATSPTSRDLPWNKVSLDPATQRLKAIFRRRHQYHPDLLYEVQVSNDLLTWITIAESRGSTPDNTGGAFSISETPVSGEPDPVFEVTVLDQATPSPAHPRRSMRVKVTQLQ